MSENDPRHNAPIEITIKVDPAAIGEITRPIGRAASAAWQTATSKTAIRSYLIFLAVIVYAVLVVLAANGVISAKVITIPIIGVVIAVIIYLKRRYSPLIPD